MADRPAEPALPVGLVPFESSLPQAGFALDVACGAGHGSLWLADRGLEVFGIDVSPVAVAQAKRLASDLGLAADCQFVAHDLDSGLPDSPSADLVVCHLFNAPELDDALVERLVPGGILAVTVLSVVDAEPGPFRAEPGELLDRFGHLDVRGHREWEGRASIVVRAAGPKPDGRLD